MNEQHVKRLSGGRNVWGTSKILMELEGVRGKGNGRREAQGLTGWGGPGRAFTEPGNKELGFCSK